MYSPHLKTKNWSRFHFFGRIAFFYLELELTVGRVLVLGGIGGRLDPWARENNSDHSLKKIIKKKNFFFGKGSELTLLFPLELRLVHSVHFGVDDEKVVSAPVVADARRINARSENAGPVSEKADLLGFVERRPKFHPVPESLEENAGVVQKGVDDDGIGEAAQFL